MDGINLKNISHRYQHQLILSNIDLQIDKHKITCLVGPNGSGKSTILKLLAGLLIPEHGSVTLDSIAISHYSQRALAKKLTYMPQQYRIPPSLKVREFVALGRFCHQSWFANLKEQDYFAIEQAMKMADVLQLADKIVTTLSSGEQQRVRIALMLAQEAEYLLLDEPMTGLDIKQQRNLLELLVTLQKKHGKTILIILHDLYQVIEIAEEVVLIKNGNIFGTGHPRSIINSDSLFKIFDCRFDLLPARSS